MQGVSRSTLGATRPARERGAHWGAAGLVLLLVVLPLAVTRFTADPFQDAKLVLLLASAAILWLSVRSIDRAIAIAAAIFVGSLVVAAIAGVNPLISLTISAYRNSDGGLLVLLASAALAVVGSSIEDDERGRARRYLVLGGIAVAIVAVAYRVAPGVWDVLLPGRVLRSTLGHPVFAAAFLSAAIGAGLGAGVPASKVRLATVAVLSLASASLDERSGVILPLVILVAWGASARPPARVWAVLVGAVVLPIVLYHAVLDPMLPAIGRSTAQQFANDGLPDARVRAWGAILEGTSERPLTGWGPGTTLTPYIRGATPDEIADIGRGWSDAHSLPVDVVAGAGVLGGLSLLALLAVLGRGWVRGPRYPWALAASISLGLFALFEPVNVVTTPLLFFLAGIAAGPPGRILESEAMRRLGMSFLIAGLIVSSVLGAAALAERWGSRYQDRDGLELALVLHPDRMTAMRRLGSQLADAEGVGDVEAAEVREAITEAVTAHPWDPVIQWWAASIELQMGDEEQAAWWLERQRARFPAETEIIDDALADIAASEAP